MKPITFERRQYIAQPAASICAEIADLARWPAFAGYGPLPGIERAEYERRTEHMVGSRVRVRNRDGSSHVEEFLEWDDGRRIVMKLHDFSPPLSRLAGHFIESWHFSQQGDGTLVRRSFEMYPTRPLTRPLVWLISLLFRRAIAAHLAQMAAEA